MGAEWSTLSQAPYPIESKDRDIANTRKDNKAVWANTEARRKRLRNSDGKRPGVSGLLSKADYHGVVDQSVYGPKCCPDRHKVYCGSKSTCETCPNGAYTDPEDIDAHCKPELFLSQGSPWVLLVASILSFILGFGVCWAVRRTET